MFELLRQIESSASSYHDLILVISGLIAVIAGLIIWLCGSGFPKLTVMILTAAVASAAAFLSGKNTPFVLTAGFVAAIISLCFNRLFIVLILATLSAVVALTVLWELAGSGDDTTANVTIYTLKHLLTQLTPMHMIVSALAFFAAVFFAIYLKRVSTALCFASMGTLMIFAGMVLLLWQKGAEPVALIGDRLEFYALVFAGMVAFGTIEQLLICPSRSTKKPQQEKKNQKTQDQSESKTDPASPVRENWRTT